MIHDGRTQEREEVQFYYIRGYKSKDKVHLNENM